MKVRIKLQQWEFVKTYVPLHIREYRIYLAKSFFLYFIPLPAGLPCAVSFLFERNWGHMEKKKRRKRKNSGTAIAAIAETRLLQCLPNPYPETVSYTTHGSPQGA